MKRQISRLMVIVGVACFCVGTVSAEEAIKLKTSKEISGSIFGTQVHFVQSWKYKEVLPLIENTGFKWIAEGCPWSQIEREKGVLKMPDEKFPHTKKFIDDAVARGLNVIVTLDCPPYKLYPTEDFEAFKRGYADYCSFVAKSLKGKVKVWKMWNEPTNNFRKRIKNGGSWNAKEGTDTVWLRKYAELTIVGAKAVKAVDPDAIIIAGSCVAPVNHHFLDILKEKGGIELVDALLLHPYPFKLPPEVQPYGGAVIKERDGIDAADDDHTYLSILRRLREKMKAVGMKSTDIYINEFGYTTFYRTLGSPKGGDTVYEAFSYEAQAKYLARYWFLHLVGEVKAAIQYDFHDDSIGVNKHPEGHFGMIKRKSQNYEPKPAFYVVQRMCALFSDPVKLFKNGFAVTANPDRYLDSKNWKYIEPSMVWDGQEIQSLNRVEKYLFKNADTGEVLLVLWNAVRASDRQDLMSTVTLDMTDYAGFTGVDIMTGKSFKVNASTKDGKTILKDVVIPDYPVIIKMSPKK